MSTMMHASYLARTIGPRGSTTERERQAARYVEQTLRTLGLEPSVEPFVSARSAWYPFALFAGLTLIGVIFLLIAGRTGAIVAFALILVALVSVLLELAFRPNPLRWLLPKGPSQNVSMRVPPTGETRRQVVVIGHLDSHRTPIVFSSTSWLRVFGTLIPLGLVSCVLLLIIAALAVLAVAPSWLVPASLLPGLVFLTVLALTLQADRTPYSPGASDNATGAAVLLSLAERFRHEPLAHTAVWALWSGCEEVGCYGAEAFARTHRGELQNTYWIPLEMLGNHDSDPKYQTAETFLLTTRCDPELEDIARTVSACQPALNAGPHTFRGAYTESVIGARYGLPVMTLTSFPPQGIETEWHRPTDTVDRLDPQVLARSEAYVLEVLQEIDRRAAASQDSRPVPVAGG